MKKVMALVCSLALVLTLAAVPAFAAEKISSLGGTATHDVTATYKSGGGSGGTGGAGGTVYSVDITWGDMAFTYTAASSGTWNPETHSVEGTSSAKWTVDSAKGNEVTVTNHSNAAVTATLTYAAETGYTGISGSFDNDTLNLKTAVGTTVSEAPTATAALSLSGALDSTTAAGTKIGTITVTLG